MYQDLMPVISIWFCDRNVVHDAPSWHTAWKVRDETGKVWSDHLEVHIVELERWRRTRPQRSAVPRERQPHHQSAA